MTVDSHVIYITSFVLIIFALIIGFIGIVFIMKEPFESVDYNDSSDWVSTSVPQDVSFECLTVPKEKRKGTSLIKLDKIITKRFPIVIEYPWNWYQTQ